MAADGTCTRRLNETRPIPIWVSAPFGQAITPSSGTITIYKGVRGDTSNPLVKPALLTNAPLTAYDNPVPSTARGWYTCTPSAIGLEADTTYTLLFTLHVVAGLTTYIREAVILLTVIDDTE